MRVSERRRRGAGVLFGAAAVLLVAGFGGCRSDRVQPAKGAGAATTRQVGASGAIAGRVLFKGQSPERVKIDMSLDPECSKAGGENRTEQVVVNDGGLANVYLYVKAGPPVMTLSVGAPAPVVLDQVGCRYVTHVIAVAVGGAVEFRNSDATMHNVHVMPAGGNRPMDVTQGPKGAPEWRVFDQTEVMVPVRCNNHPWMSAFVNVSATPFFAVSDEKGWFRIAGLPPGVYTLAAVHEQLGEQEMKLTIAPGEQRTAEFTYSMR